MWPSKEYCFIYPKQTLLDQLQFLQYVDARELFDRPILWETYSSHRDVWSEKERTGAIKLLFLIDLYKEYAQPLLSFVQGLLGEPPFSTETFDEWWNIDYILGEDATLDQILAKLTRVDLDLVTAPTLPEAKTILEGWIGMA